MTQMLTKTAIVVQDYDDAIEFYVTRLGFTCTEDTDLGGGKRWVTVKPPGSNGAELLLARAVSDEQRSRVGNQTGGRVFLFIETDDLARDVALYKERGVTFARQPEKQPWGTVAVIQDLCGNLIDIIEPLAKPRRIRDYHAHIYFDEDTVDLARQLRISIGEQFAATLGNWNEALVGPHPRWSAEIIFANAEFATLVPWLALNRAGLTIFVHPNTGGDLADHRDHAIWLGNSVELNLGIFTD